MNVQLTWLSLFCLLSILLYCMYEYRNSRRIQDEREVQIKYLTHTCVQKLTVSALLLLSCALIFFPILSARVVLVTLILTSLYGEMLADRFYRRRL